MSWHMQISGEGKNHVEPSAYWMLKTEGVQRTIMKLVASIMVLSWFSCSNKPSGHRPPNILFIAIDDLRPVLGCYGNKTMISPVMDSLAMAGVLFENAYCQEAVCNPSRASLMTGRRPDNIGVWTLKTHFREKNPDAITLPQFFKERGYSSREVGKIYHDGAYFKDPVSWSGESFYNVTQNDPGHKYNLEENLIPPRSKAAATEEAAVSDSAYIDGKVADAAIRLLNELKDTSFFLAVGFRRPHLPFSAPKKYWDYYQRSDFAEELTHLNAPEGTPVLAMTNSNELRGYEDIVSEGPIDVDKQLELLHGYYASTSYVDAQIGKLMKTLRQLDLTTNTIVVLWSDHGYHLGDFGLWCKSTNFEAATRVALLFSGGPIVRNRKENAIVELLDVYPTLVDLAGFPVPDYVQGNSIKPMLLGQEMDKDPVALSQFVRPYAAINQQDPQIMGYSIRTPDYRFIEWRKFPEMDVIDRELYDLHESRIEAINLAQRKEFQPLMDSLAVKIDQIRN